MVFLWFSYGFPMVKSLAVRGISWDPDILQSIPYDDQAMERPTAAVAVSQGPVADTNG